MTAILTLCFTAILLFVIIRAAVSSSLHPKRRRKTSLLGCLSLIVATVALVSTRVPIAGVGPVTIGVLGAAIGLLGLLSAVVIGHTGRVLPVFAMLLCLGAAGYGLYANGHDDGVGARDRLDQSMAREQLAAVGIDRT